MREMLVPVSVPEPFHHPGAETEANKTSFELGVGIGLVKSIQKIGNPTALSGCCGFDGTDGST